MLSKSAWVSCNGGASIVGALIMYGVGLADNVSIANWRVMFLICGGATALCGIVFVLLMPQGPETAWFLTETERQIACQRLQDPGSVITEDKPKFQKSQVLEALKDPFCWSAVLIGFLGTFASPVLKFASLVISGFGWSPFNTMLVGLPSGFLQILFIWITVIGIRVTKIPRCFWGVAVTALPLIGNIGIYLIPATNKWGVVAFTWLATVISPVMVVSLSLMASNIKGTTKKSAVSNAYFSMFPPLRTSRLNVNFPAMNRHFPLYHAVPFHLRETLTDENYNSRVWRSCCGSTSTLANC